MLGDRVENVLRDSLLSDLHGQPVIWIKGDRIEGLNVPARGFFGCDPRGRQVSDVFDEQSAKKIEHLISSGSSAARTELQIERPDALPSLASFAVVRGSHADLMLIAVSQGVTYTEEAGQQLLSAIEDLAASLRRLGREMRDVTAAKESLERIDDLREVFLAALAHDLRSPLNAILLAEQLLEMNDGLRFDEPIASHSMLVERNIRLALELVDSVVSAARLDAANPVLRTERVQLNDVARRWCDAFASVASSAEVSLHLVGEDVPEVCGDPMRLGEVFSNLLSNAIRHSPTGGRVLVEMSRRGDQLFCCVADQGPGVPAAMRSAIFDKFSQGHSSEGVSGLGLYICRRIVELHGGRIWAEDNHPCGARFVFTLPLSNGTA